MILWLMGLQSHCTNLKVIIKLKLGIITWTMKSHLSKIQNPNIHMQVWEAKRKGGWTSLIWDVVQQVGWKKEESLKQLVKRWMQLKVQDRHLWRKEKKRHQLWWSSKRQWLWLGPLLDQVLTNRGIGNIILTHHIKTLSYQLLLIIYYNLHLLQIEYKRYRFLQCFQKKARTRNQDISGVAT